MDWSFEDYEVGTGYTAHSHTPYAALAEFAALVATGDTHQDAIVNLRVAYEQRVRSMREEGRPIPAPGDQPESVGFASTERVDALAPFVAEFWERILRTSYSTSFVSDNSRFSSWEHYVGGRDELIRRVRAVYGVDISDSYDEPIPDVLARIREELT
jgi:predicted RNase H-like HicB family nuclease